MKKHKLFSTISLILSGIVMAMSGFVFVHSASQQSASTSLTVTYEANNVNYSASAFYQVEGEDTKSDLTSTGLAGGATTISFSASEASSNKYLKTVTDPVLTADKNYVLFTYAFTNTASSGAYDMTITLDDGSVTTGTVTVKYYTSSTNYFDTNGDKSDALANFISDITSTTEVSTTVVAGNTIYYYVLISMHSSGTISGSYTSTVSNGLVWSVACANTINGVNPNLSAYTVSLFGTPFDGTGTSDFEIYYQTGTSVPEHICRANSVTSWRRTCTLENPVIHVTAGDNLYLCLYYKNSSFAVSGVGPAAYEIISSSGLSTTNGGGSDLGTVWYREKQPWNSIVLTIAVNSDFSIYATDVTTRQVPLD